MRVGILVGARCTGFICLGRVDRSKSGRMYLYDVRSGMEEVMMRSSKDKWLRANHAGYTVWFLAAIKTIESLFASGYGLLMNVEGVLVL